MADVVVAEAVVFAGHAGGGRRGGGGVGADAVQHRGTDEAAVSSPGQEARLRFFFQNLRSVFRDQRHHYRYMVFRLFCNRLCHSPLFVVAVAEAFLFLFALVRVALRIGWCVAAGE